MRNRYVISGLIVAASIGSAAAALPSSPVTGRVAAAGAADGTFVVDTPTGDVAFKANGQTVFVRGDALARLTDLKVGDRVRINSAETARGRVAVRVETLSPGTPAAKTVTGSVASVDVSENRVTIDMPSGSTALKSINTGDPVRIQVAPGAALASRIDVLASGVNEEGILGAYGSRARRSLGVWLLAMTGTLVALRARRLRLV